MMVTEEGFALMTKLLMEIAASCCPGKILLTLEGGYHLNGLVTCIATVLKTLSDDMPQNERRVAPEEAIKEGTLHTIEQVQSIFSTYWKGL